MKTPRQRCAIYTRKSTDEGLDQDFNSLHAQREACEAYVVSQVSLGWTVLPDTYDDGGVSGGTMERPALIRLMEEIKANRIDVVVVYKIDRLTRSLMDFARIVDLFDRHGVSFVSVTQQFNTTTSMGRLTLNVLLSFAQFEREVTAERIRDKIAASRKKGLWMGGTVPLGYRVENKALIPCPNTTETVRHIFQRYLDLKSVRLLSDDLGESHLAGLPPGMPISRGRLFYLLSNPVYIGKARHKDQVHDGVHEAIVDQPLFDQVQSILTAQAPRRRQATNTKGHPSTGGLLTGLVFDETGDRLSPVHANKKGKRYHYYVSRRLIGKTGPSSDSTGWRLPARSLELAVEAQLCGLLRNPAELSRLLADHLNTDDMTPMIHQAPQRADHYISLSPPHRRDILIPIIKAIRIAPDTLSLEIRTGALMVWVLNTSKDGHGSRSSSGDQYLRLQQPLTLKRRGVETKLVMEDSAQPMAEPDPVLVNLLAKAHRAFDYLTDGN